MRLIKCPSIKLRVWARKFELKACEKSKPQNTNESTCNYRLVLLRFSTQLQVLGAAHHIKNQFGIPTEIYKLKH
jgi:hypothetical protein